MKCIPILKFATFIILTSLQACQSPEKKESSPQTELVTNSEADHDHEQKVVTELSLNNGAKWKADSSTNKNVVAFRKIVESAKPTNVEDYRNTGENLEQSIKKMISECRMQGPDHEALHHWLEPLMEENKKLLEVTTAEKGKDMLEMIRKQIENYSAYFE